MYKVVNGAIVMDDNHLIISDKKHSDLRHYEVTFKCLKHNVVNKQNRSVLSRKGCITCNKEVRRLQPFVNIKKLNDNRFIFLSPYLNSSEKLRVKERMCGHEYDLSPRSLKGVYNRKCLVCNKSLFTVNNFKEYLSTFKDDYYAEGYELLESKLEKVTSLTKLKLKHINCENIITMTHSQFFKAHNRCKYCNNVTNSRTAAIVEAILKINSSKYTKEFKFDDCKNKRSLPFDFKVDCEDDAFILIEVDGKQHYSKKDRFYNSQTIENDKIKNKYCKVNGIRLYRLKVDDYKTIDSVYNHLSKYLPIDTKPSFKDVDMLYNNKITSDIAHDMRLMYSEGYSVKDIICKYNVSSKSVYNTLNYVVQADTALYLKDDIKLQLSYQYEYQFDTHHIPVNINIINNLVATS